MTTDPFTEAAMEHLATVDHDKSRDWFDGFVACTAWARTRLAAQEPTDAEIDAAARTWAESGPTAAVWEQMAEERREYTRERMHACLSAARAARRDEERR